MTRARNRAAGMDARVAKPIDLTLMLTTLGGVPGSAEAAAWRRKSQAAYPGGDRLACSTCAAV